MEEIARERPSVSAQWCFETTDAIAALHTGADVYAGAVISVLDGLLRLFRDNIFKDSKKASGGEEWDKSGPLIWGCSIGAIIIATANNFRHNNEWERDKWDPTPLQVRSIKVLAAALREPDGANHKLGRDVCREILQLLSDGSFDTLGEKFFAFANSMVKGRRRPA
jgi:hypothetical protein